MRLIIGRRALYIGFLIAGVTLIGTAWSLETGERGRDLALDLGVEVIGLGLTVGILDWFFERRRLLAEGKRLAWELYYAIERIAWIWQGGPRRLDTEEVVGLLESVGPGDELADETLRLMYGIGIRGRQLLRGEHETVDAMPKLRESLEALGTLPTVHQGRRRTLHPHAVAEALRKALSATLEILQLEPSFVPDLLIRDRDSALRAQQDRYETEFRAHTRGPA